MSANTVLGSFKHCCKSASLLSVLLSVTVVYGSDSNTNASIEQIVLRTGFESKVTSDWSLREVGGAKGTVELESIADSTVSGSNALRLTVTEVGQRCGVSLSDHSAIEIQSNQWYDLTFRARTEKRENDRGYGLTVSIESGDGKLVCARTTLPEVGGDWRDYKVALHSRLAHSAAILTITMSEPGTIWFDDITLKQRQTGREMRTP